MTREAELWDSNYDWDGWLRIAPGGKITFANGTWAEVKTTSSEHFKVDSEYLVFLKKDEQNEYSPLGGSEGIYELSWKDQTVTPFASLDGLPHRINSEVANQIPFTIVSISRGKVSHSR